MSVTQLTSVHLGVVLAHLEAQGAAGGLVLRGAGGRRGREQDGAPLSAERDGLTATGTRIGAVTSTLGLCERETFE